MVALNNSNSHSDHEIREVLLVEDEEISRRALCLLLEAEGFTITTAASAEEALQLITGGAHPQLALIDLDLPGMNGLELIGQLAKRDPKMLAILITASSRERLQETLGSQHLAYMRKPLDFKRLLNLLTHTQLPA